MKTFLQIWWSSASILQVKNAQDFKAILNTLPEGVEALIINASAPYCMHLLFYLTTRSLICLYLTTIVTMVDNIINDIHGSIGQCCLYYCRTLQNIVVLTTRGLIILYLTTRGLIFLFNDNSDNGRQLFYDIRLTMIL